MKRHSVTKHYISYTEQEALQLPEEILGAAVEVEFSNGATVEVDEIIKAVDGRLYLSSYQHGVVRWDEEKKCYVHHYHFSKRDIGQVVRVIFSKGK